MISPSFSRTLVGHCDRPSRSRAFGWVRGCLGDGVAIYTLLYVLMSTWTRGRGGSALGGGKEGRPAASLQVRKLVGAT